MFNDTRKEFPCQGKKDVIRWQAMEVSLLDKNTLRIKGKKAALVVDPKEKMAKTSSDAIIALDSDFDPKNVSDYRIIINQPGEYEVGGVKITALGSDNLYYGLNIDNTQVLLAKTSSLDKLSKDMNDPQVAVLNVDSEINGSLVAAIEPKIVILYGEKAQDGAKVLGSQDPTPVKKFSVTADKLPQESQIIVWLS
jgi:hypothetical protein